jgi:hypothetical protein
MLPRRGLTIRISGGLPPGTLEPKPAPPPGADLKRQHAMFARRPTERAPVTADASKKVPLR